MDRLHALMQPRIRGHLRRVCHQRRERNQPRRTGLQNRLPLHLAQPDHPVLEEDPVAGTRPQIVSRIVAAGLRAQVDDAGADRKQERRIYE